MSLSRFSNLRTNILDFELFDENFVDVPFSYSLLEECFERFEKKIDDIQRIMKILSKDVLKRLMNSILIKETDNYRRCKMFSFALYFVDIYAQQKQNRDYRITSISYTFKNTLSLSFADSINQSVKTFETKKPNPSVIVNAELFKKHHIVANSIMINFNTNKKLPKMCQKHNIFVIEFTKSFIDSKVVRYEEDLYVVELASQYVFDESIGKFKSNQSSKYEIFENSDYVGVSDPFNYDHNNMLLFFNQLEKYTDNNGHIRTKKKLIMVFEINFLKNVLYLRGTHTRDIRSHDWRYILNHWLNHIIYPGASEGNHFEISKKDDNYILSIMKGQTVLRHMWMKNDRFRDNNMWFFLSNDFNMIFRQVHYDITQIFNQDIFNSFLEIYQKKKPFCPLHPTIDLQKVVLNNVFNAYRGVLFIGPYGDNQFETCQIFKDLSIFENPFHNCKKCVKYEKTFVEYCKTTQHQLRELYLRSVFMFKNVKFSEPRRSQESVASSSNTRQSDPNPSEDTQINLNFIIYNDLPSKGGSVMINFVNFPLLTLRYAPYSFQITFDLKYLPFCKQEEYKFVKFGIWGVDHGIAHPSVFHESMLHPDRPVKIRFDKSMAHLFSPHASYSEMFYGELEGFIPWGKCEIKDDMTADFIRDINYTPECVKEFHLQQSIDTKMKRSINQLQLSDLPPLSTTSLSIHESSSDIESEVLHNKFKIQSIWFILQNDLNLPPEVMESQIERGALYTDPYQRASKKNFYIKMMITDAFNIPQLSDNHFENLINSDSFELPQENKYFINFVYHPLLRERDLSNSVPSYLKCSYGTKTFMVPLKDLTASLMDGFFGHQAKNITIKTITNINVETEIMKFLFV